MHVDRAAGAPCTGGDLALTEHTPAPHVVIICFSVVDGLSFRDAYTVVRGGARALNAPRLMSVRLTNMRALSSQPTHLLTPPDPAHPTPTHLLNRVCPFLVVPLGGVAAGEADRCAHGPADRPPRAA